MGITIKTKLHWKYLEVIVLGNYELESAVNRFPQMLTACKLSGIKNVFIDFSRVKGDIGASFSGIYAIRIEEEYREYLKTGGYELKIAYYHPDTSYHKSGESIAQKSGLPFKLFSDKDKAIKWLEENEEK